MGKETGSRPLILLERIGLDTVTARKETMSSMGLVFNGQMTSEDYARIFIESKPKWSTWTLEEKVAYREKLARALNAGRVELASVEQDIGDEKKKLSKEEREALESALDLTSDPTKRVTRKSAEFKAIESYAKALGLSVEEAAKALSKMKVPVRSPICEVHGIEMKKVANGWTCPREDQNELGEEMALETEVKLAGIPPKEPKATAAASEDDNLDWLK